MYNDFAEVYDSLMDNVDYGKWAAYYAGLMGTFGIKKGMVCECACGTGNLTIPLSHLGYNMTGVDLSSEMLFAASTKARKQGLSIPFIRQDMRKLKLHRPMDAVLATCDGVNYLTGDQDAPDFFSAAYDALRPGGCLIFDVSTIYKLENILGNRIICEDRDDVTYMWQNCWNPGKKTVNMHLCIFVREEDGRYRRIDEEQTQRGYTPAQLEFLLEKAGFENVQIFGDGTMASPGKHEQRIHCAAVKKAEISKSDSEVIIL